MQHPAAVELVKASTVLVDRAAVEVTGFSVLHPFAVMVAPAAIVSEAGGATVNGAAGDVVPMPTLPAFTIKPYVDPEISTSFAVVTVL